MQARICGMKNNRRPKSFKVRQGFKDLHNNYIRKGSIITETAQHEGNVVCSVLLAPKKDSGEATQIVSLISTEYLSPNGIYSCCVSHI